MTILRAENELVLAGIEAVYGTAEVLTGADAIQCDFEITPMEATPKERAYSRPFFGARPTILTEIHRSIKMSNIEMGGASLSIIPPPWAPIMRACGWSVTVIATGGGSVRMQPVTNALDSLTIEPSIDGELFRMVGARGTVSMMFEIGEFPTMEANLKGGWVNPETLVSVPEPDYSEWPIPRAINCENTPALNIGGEAYPFYSLKIDQGSNVEFFCVPGESGYRIEIVNRAVKGTVKLQAKQISDHNLFTLVKSNSLVPVAFDHGTAPGGRLSVEGPAVQFLNPRKSDYKGDLAWECDMIWTPTAPDNEIVVIAR